ncbi:unnamed protein product, partial [Choristocarpus tenellus]
MLIPIRAFLGKAIRGTGSRVPLSFTARIDCLREVPLRCSISMANLAPGSDGRGKVVVIAGPTASGKSSIGMELCKRIGGEIVSADSVQVYRQLNIGSNKPSPVDRAEVNHHLIDIAGLEDTFTAGDFVRLAHAAIDDIISRGRVPVVVGGTMMYIQWLVDGTPNAPKKDPAVARAVVDDLRPYQERNDWEGGLQV